MATVWQEMHCSPDGGGCGCYFSIAFEDTITANVGIRCGICKHPHSRRVVKGNLQEEGRYVGGVGKNAFEVEVLMSACYPTPRTQKMLEHQMEIEKARKGKGRRSGDIRDGVKGDEEVVAAELTPDEKARRQIMLDSWHNKFLNETFG